MVIVPKLYIYVGTYAWNVFVAALIAIVAIVAIMIVNSNFFIKFYILIFLCFFYSTHSTETNFEWLMAVVAAILMPCTTIAEVCTK